MKNFILKIVVFSAVLFFVLKLVDFVVTSGLQKSETKIFQTITKAYQGNINADLIINGSSKALVQVDPFILDSVLTINSYNLGLDGSPFIPQKALFELYKQHNKKPKVVVQIVSNGALRSLAVGFRNPIKFAPYLENPEVKKHMKLTSGFGYFDYRIPMLRYSGYPFEVITGILTVFNINLFNYQDNKGYTPHDKSMKNDSTEDEISSFKASNESIVTPQKIEEFTSLESTSCELFEEFLENCYKEDILVFLVYPPIYAKNSSTVKNIDYYVSVSKKYNARFLNYSNDSTLVNNRELFYDSQHLNIYGATKFTHKLAIDIKAQTQSILYN
jgi:hypothetical protein